MNLTVQVKPCTHSRSLVRVRLKHALLEGNATVLIACVDYKNPRVPPNCTFWHLYGNRFAFIGLTVREPKYFLNPVGTSWSTMVL